jgi:hypothetical protein
MLAATALTLAGCASGGQPPTAELAVTQSTISEAERGGAVQYAPVELNRARQKLESAQQAVRSEEYEQARRLAAEAEVDAKLARAKTDASLAERSVNTINQDISTLRREAMPSSGTSTMPPMLSPGGAAGTGTMTPIPIPTPAPSRATSPNG